MSDADGRRRRQLPERRQVRRRHGVSDQMIMSIREMQQEPNDRLQRIEFLSGPGYCDIIFAVGDSANVSVFAHYLKRHTPSLRGGRQAAALVEPKLP